MWDIHKYYENSDYVRIIMVIDPDTIKENITNERLVQDANTEYKKLILYKRQGPVTSDRKYNEPKLSK